jgi:hypothetical protein
MQWVCPTVRGANFSKRTWDQGSLCPGFGPRKENGSRAFRIDILQIGRCFERVQGGSKSVKVCLMIRIFKPKWSVLASRAFRLDILWEMFWKGLRWIKIRQSLPRWSEFSSQSDQSLASRAFILINCRTNYTWLASTGVNGRFHTPCKTVVNAMVKGFYTL